MKVEKLRVINEEQKLDFGTSNSNEKHYIQEIFLEDNIFSCFHYISFKDVLILDSNYIISRLYISSKLSSRKISKLCSRIIMYQFV